MTATMTQSNGARAITEEADFLQLKAIDHVQWLSLIHISEPTRPY